MRVVKWQLIEAAIFYCDWVEQASETRSFVHWVQQKSNLILEGAEERSLSAHLANPLRCLTLRVMHIAFESFNLGIIAAVTIARGRSV